MGTGVYPCAIRVNARKAEASISTDFVLLGTPVAYEQLEFINLHDDAWDVIKEAHDLCWQHYRGPVWRYDFFSALVGDDHGYVLPMLNDTDALREVGKQLIAWLDEARGLEYLRDHPRSMGFSGVPRVKSFEHEYLYDQRWPATVLDLARLRAFDFDQPVRVNPPNPETEIGDVRYQERLVEYAGKVYRDLMPREFFNFLQWCEKENWHYLVCQFDS
jgi:hypothetical protein